jgi:hypothetical protein
MGERVIKTKHFAAYTLGELTRPDRAAVESRGSRPHARSAMSSTRAERRIERLVAELQRVEDLAPK